MRSRTFCTLFAVLGTGLFTGSAPAAEIKLARTPDYHNGKIVFSYLGDVWRVNEDGSSPQRLTVHNARDINPRFSPDGKWIAFSSNRFGNYDVFVIGAEGGKPKQLTYHSGGDLVVGWSRDSKRIMFSSARGRVFPGIPSLYEINVEGGLEQPLPADWGWYASYSPDGSKLAFNRHPLPWTRKHYRGSYAADLWVADLASKNFRRLVDDTLADEMRPNNFWPMYAQDAIYFVSDRDVMAKAGTGQVMTSTNNLWKVSADGGAPVQVTKHTSGNLFSPSLSADGRVIVYEENFGLWKLDVASGETREIKVNIISDDKENTLETLVSNSDADSFHLSPSARRAVITVYGELFTIATERGDIRRLTQTSHVRETQPQWSPDGKWIAFVSDASGREEIWLCDEFGKQLRQVSDADSNKSTPVWAPDAKSLLYSASDKKLHRYDLANGQTKVIASGTVIGFAGLAVMSPQWSPDGKWVSFTKMGIDSLPHVYVAASEGGQEYRITDPTNYSDSGALWTPDGKKLIFLSGQDTGNLGQMGRSTAQLCVVPLQPEEKDPADRNVDSEEDAQRTESEQRRELLKKGLAAKPGTDDKSGRGEAMQKQATKPGDRERIEVKIDFNRIARRVRQLTRVSDQISGVAVAPDSRSVAFVTSGTEGGRPVQSIWTIGLDGDRLNRVIQASRTIDEDGPPRLGGMFGGLGSLQFTKDGRTLYYRQGGGIYSVSVGAGPAGPTGGDAAATAARPSDSPLAAVLGARASATAQGKRINFTARVDVDHARQRKQVFNEGWRVMKYRFYDPGMHGVDWDRMKAVYEPLLEHVADQDELHTVMSQMIGELNASHTGVSGGRAAGEQRNTSTRHPGFEFEPDASGFFKVTHVYKNGPADKDFVKIRVGDFILAVDDHDLKAGDNYWQHYTAAPGARLEFTVNAKPVKDGAWKAKVTPITLTTLANLQYEKWVDDRREQVDKLSNGTIGYLHIRQMNEPSLRQFERDLGMMVGKKALIIDQRFNPGGNIDQELLQILQQRQYQYTKNRDSVEVTRPLRGFFGPMVVMQNERSTSDAEVFPDGFRTLKLGKVVGVTTYGAVIGTGAYQLMDGSTIRTPGSGLWNVNGTNLENYGVPPDIYVDNRPEDFLRGRDAQLERSVEVLK